MRRARSLLRLVLAVLMIGIGTAHFTNPEPFIFVVPSFLPAPGLLVALSGAFEILGGAGLLVPRTRLAAAWGLIALYVAVFPANVNMAVNNIVPPGTEIPAIALWLRLPLQALLVAWAWWVRRDETSADVPVAPVDAKAPPGAT